MKATRKRLRKQAMWCYQRAGWMLLLPKGRRTEHLAVLGKTDTEAVTELLDVLSATAEGRRIKMPWPA